MRAAGAPGGSSAPGSVFMPQLESSLREKSRQLESVQETKSTLGEQLRKETAAKVTLSLII